MAAHSGLALESPVGRGLSGCNPRGHTESTVTGEHTGSDINGCAPFARRFAGRFFHVLSESCIFNVIQGKKKRVSSKVSGKQLRFFWFCPIITSRSCSHGTLGPLRQEVRGAGQ